MVIRTIIECKRCMARLAVDNRESHPGMLGHLAVMTEDGRFERASEDDNWSQAVVRGAIGQPTHEECLALSLLRPNCEKPFVVRKIHYPADLYARDRRVSWVKHDVSLERQNGRRHDHSQMGGAIQPVRAEGHAGRVGRQCCPAHR